MLFPRPLSANNMSTNPIGQIEEAIFLLRRQELRAWLAEYDAEVWDQQFHADAISGRLDAMADQAMKDFSEGRSTDL